MTLLFQDIWFKCYNFFNDDLLNKACFIIKKHENLYFYLKNFWTHGLTMENVQSVII